MSKSTKRKLSFVMAFALIISCFGSITSFAFDEGHYYADTYTGAVTSYITSASQTDWYQFTLTAEEVPTAYSITLKIPSSCVYNFDLRHRATGEDEDVRPMIVSNETLVTGSRNRTMHGVLTEPGTYFVRVYSQNGTTSSMDNYKLTVSYDKDGTYGFMYDNNLPTGETTDWSICADMLGQYTFDRIIKYATNNRNYQNAYTFISTNYDSDSQSGYGTALKATPAQTSIAADYIFSGDLMSKPKFKVENNKIYEIEELMYYVWDLSQPVIFYLENSAIPYDAFKKYVILEDANIGENTITYYNPSDGSRTTVDYDEFLTDGFTYSGVPVTYSGTNIVDANNVRAVQPIYN